MHKLAITLTILTLFITAAQAQTVIRDRTMDVPVVTDENSQPDDMAEVNDSDIIDQDEDDTELEDNDDPDNPDANQPVNNTQIFREEGRTIIVQPDAEDYRRVLIIEDKDVLGNTEQDDDEKTVVLSDEEQAWVDFTANADLSEFVIFLETANLDELLQTGASYTILAPTNSAFSRMKPTEKERLNNPDRIDDMRRRIAYHVIPGLYTTDDLKVGDNRLRSLEGAKVTLRKGANNVHAENARIRRKNLSYGHLIVHKIDAVLTPVR